MQTNRAEHARLQAAGNLPTQPASGAAVHIDSLSKSYGARRVLEDINLHIEPGEFVAVVGRSGCGKSTLLRLIAALDTPGAGRVEVAGDGIADIRIMFQEARLLPWKSVRDNVGLGLPRNAAAPGVVLEQVGLADRAHEWPTLLSGGQRQRVALARALVHEPALLLLDEPLGALDALTRIEMQQLLESVWQMRGFTAFLVTHDVHEAVVLADRVLLIEAGRIALDLRVDLPRPRRRSDPGFASIEEQLLSHLLRH